MADVKWIKIVTDIFDDEKMLLIDGLPEHDGIIVIWFKLLCMAGKQNNGGVFTLNDKIAYTDEMLATIFRRPVATVRLALKTFEQFGMIEIINNTITIPNWEKHQSLDKLEQAKEKNRQRVAAHRERQKALASGNDYSNITVMPCNEIDKDKDKEIDKEKEQKKKELYNVVIARLNEKAGTNYRATSKTTQGHINARLAEGFTVKDFYTVIDKKCAEWKGGEMAKYLRPETLFGTKFEGYLNAKTNSKTYGRNGIAISNEPSDLDDVF